MSRWLVLPLVLLCGGRSFADSVTFNRDVRPILADACFSCHGPSKQKGGLRLDKPDSATEPTKAGTTAFTVGSGTQIIRQGIVCHPCLLTTSNIGSQPPGSVLAWDFGVNGMPPLYLVGAADFLVLNLNAVTPVTGASLAVNIFWDESAL